MIITARVSAEGKPISLTVKVFLDKNSTTEQFIFLTNETLEPLLDYDLLSLETVPVRMGFENLTFLTAFSTIT